MRICNQCSTPKEITDFPRNSSYKDGREKKCKACKYANTQAWRDANPEKVKKNSQDWYKNNREQRLVNKRKYRQRHPERVKQQVKNAINKYGNKYNENKYYALIKKRFGLTREMIRIEIEKQNGVCAICKGTQKCGNRKKLYLDHDHVTKKYRGFLCFSCNSMLGFAKDKIEILLAAIEYLNTTRSDKSKGEKA